MPTARQHKKPAMPKEQQEAMKVAQTMYLSLTAPGAPRATSAGYVMGACQVLGMLMKQAVEQGAKEEDMKLFALQYIHKFDCN